MSKKVFNMQGGKHSAAAYTELEKFAYGNVVASIASFVVSAGAGMNVNISTGAGLITDTIARRIGTDAVETATVPAASASFNRIDSVVAYIDTAVTPTTAVTDNTNDILKFVVVAGTASASPAAPTNSAILAAIGAGKPYMVLYDLLLPQNAVNLSGITLTDRRKIMTQIQAGQFAASAIATADIADSAVTTAKINDLAATTRKMKPSYAIVNAGAGVSRQTFSGSGIFALTGMSISYTSGPTAERLIIEGEFIMQLASPGAQGLIRINGTPIGKTTYQDMAGGFAKNAPRAFYDIAANTTVTITMAVKNVSGLSTVANANGDQALSESYGQELRVMAFGR